MREITVVGNISRDTVWYGDSKRGTFWGGAGFNVACAIAHDGVRPKLISVIGEQDAVLLDALEESIDTSQVRVLPGKTCHFDIWYTQEGEFCTIACQFGVAACLDSYLQQSVWSPRHYHLSCRHPLHPAPVLATLRSLGIPFSLDFMASSAREQIPYCKDWIEDAVCVFVNRQEFAILCSIVEIQKIRTLVVTAGSAPVVIYCYGKEVARKPCPHATIYDVTGAGDIITGTFLAAHMIDEESVDIALEKAIDAAHTSLRYPGVASLILGENA